MGPGLWIKFRRMLSSVYIPLTFLYLISFLYPQPWTDATITLGIRSFCINKYHFDLKLQVAMIKLQVGRLLSDVKRWFQTEQEASSSEGLLANLENKSQSLGAVFKERQILAQNRRKRQSLTQRLSQLTASSFCHVHVVNPKSKKGRNSLCDISFLNFFPFSPFSFYSYIFFLSSLFSFWVFFFLIFFI